MLRLTRNRMTIAKKEIPFSYKLQMFEQKGGKYSFPLCGDIYRRLLQDSPELDVQDDLSERFAEIVTSQKKLIEIVEMTDCIGNLKLYPGQRVGVKWLKTIKKGILADLQGTGKTVQSLTAADELEVQYPIVLCQNSKKKEWLEHAAEWSPSFNPVKFNPNKEQKAGDITIMTADSAILHYEKLVDTDLIILDEAHKLRNRKTGLFKGIKRIARKSEYLFMLSGDPVVNGIDDIWTLLYLCDSDRFSSYWGFAFRFCEIQMDQMGMKVGPLLDAERDNLNRIFKIYMLARSDKKSDVEMKWLTVNCELRGAQKSLYDQFDRHGEAEFKDESVFCPSTLSVITRKRQMALHPGLAFSNYIGPNKLQYLIPPIEQWEGKTVIFTQYADFAEIIDEFLQYHGYSCGLYTGKRKRQTVLDAFKVGELDILTTTYKMGGEGLDLYVASQVILAEYPWHMSGVKQAIMRIDRDGQESKFLRTVILHTINTVEDHIRDIIREKRKVTLSEIRRRENAD